LIRKIAIALNTLAVLAWPTLVLACPVCFGSQDSAQTRGAQAGIAALLVVTVGVLVSIAGFFFIYLRRRIRMFEESNGGSY
jgi:membrane protein DedA with SNARE-associated domain